MPSSRLNDGTEIGPPSLLFSNSRYITDTLYAMSPIPQQRETMLPQVYRSVLGVNSFCLGVQSPVLSSTWKAMCWPEAMGPSMCVASLLNVRQAGPACMIVGVTV